MITEGKVMSRIGEKVSKARENKAMSKKQLAKKLGVSEKFITEVESGRKIINENLMNKLSKIFGEDINDITMNFEEQARIEEKNNTQNLKTNYKAPEKIKDTWSDALSSILKTVPVYGYNLNKVIDKRQMPIISNKIEGFAQDKVLFLHIENDEMIGFRIAKGDIAFSHLTHEIMNNSICLIEYNGERVIRQIKTLGGEKILLINNGGTLRTETVNKKSFKVLAKLERVEFKL